MQVRTPPAGAVAYGDPETACHRPSARLPPACPGEELEKGLCREAECGGQQVLGLGREDSCTPVCPGGGQLWAQGPSAGDVLRTQRGRGGGCCSRSHPPPAPRTPLLRDTWAPTWARRPLGVCSIRHLADASITNMQVVSGSGGQKPSTTQASLLVPRSPWANQEKASHRGQGSGELQ